MGVPTFAIAFLRKLIKNKRASEENHRISSRWIPKEGFRKKIIGFLLNMIGFLKNLTLYSTKKSPDVFGENQYKKKINKFSETLATPRKFNKFETLGGKWSLLNTGGGCMPCSGRTRIRRTCVDCNVRCVGVCV